MIMNKHFNEFNELTHRAGNYLEQDLCYSLRTTQDYRRIWKQVREFMFSNGLTRYSKSVEEKFLRFRFKNKGWKDLTVNQRATYNGLKMLTEYYLTGRINVPSQPSKYPLVFSGPIGKVISSFLDHKQQKGMSRCRLHYFQRHLYEFMKYFENQGYADIKDIDLPIILHFINQYDCVKKTAMVILISTLRAFMRYLFDQNLVDLAYIPLLPVKPIPQMKQELDD